MSVAPTVVPPDLVLRLMRNLTLTKGRWAGSKLALQPFQEELTTNVFALDDEGKGRRYEEALVFMPRKNAKTTTVAAWALALLMEEPGGEVLGVAAKRDQAQLMMDAAKQFVRSSSFGGVPLTDHFTLRRNAIIYPPLDAVYRVISSEASSEHGANPHAVLADELHAWRDPELLYAMQTATAARENPLMVGISTPGERPSGVWWDAWGRALEAQAGRSEDPKLYGRVWTAHEDCDIHDEDAYEASNPGLDAIVTREYLHRQASTLPEYVFRRLHLGQPTTAHERWLPLHLWTACAERPDIPEGGTVYLGIDAALSRDTFAAAMVYVDEDDVAHTVTRDWTPDHDRDYIDPAEVLTWVLGVAQRYKVGKVYYDPAYMGLLATSLEDRGVPVEPLPQSAMNMVRATETLQRLVFDGKLRHGGDPALDRQLAAAATRETDRGVRLSKGRSGSAIDRAVALVMALDAAYNGDKPETHFAFGVGPRKADGQGAKREERGARKPPPERHRGSRRRRPGSRLLTGQGEGPTRQGWREAATRIVLVVGPPGAGKTTYVREHKAAGDVVVDYDLIAEALGSSDSHDHTVAHEDVSASRNAMLNRVRRGQVKADRVWLVSANPDAERIFPYHEVVEVDPGLDAVLERIHEGGRPTEWKRLATEWYRKRNHSTDDHEES